MSNRNIDAPLPADASTPRFVAVGECMVELAQTGPESYRRGFAGDTFNTAWYARRLLPPHWSVAYLSAIGEDAISGEMRDFIAGEGVDTRALRTVPGRSVGLYMISTENGERRFAYWRDTSAARCLADDPAWLSRHLDGARMIHVSGITLAILSPAARARLLDTLERARRGGATVSFDTNLRPALWSSEAEARDWLSRCAAVADIVLPSFDEESAMFGDAAPEDTVARYRTGGSGTVVVKNGADAVTGWSAATGSFSYRPERVARPVDTTAAGDSFAAALLAALAEGADLGDAVAAAARLSARVIGHAGALVPALFAPAER